MELNKTSFKCNVFTGVMPFLSNLLNQREFYALRSLR